MRGTVWLLLVSLPTGIIIAAGLLATELAICARALPASPFYFLAEVGIEFVLMPELGVDFLGALREARSEVRR